MAESVTSSVPVVSGPDTTKFRNIPLRWIFAIALVGVFAGPTLFGQDTLSNPEDYKFKIGASFWYAKPTMSVAGSSSQVPVSFDKTLGFNDYSTFTAAADWHITKRQHILFMVSPNQTSRTAVLAQNITLQNQTFLAGSSVNASIRTYSYTPGYRFDFIHNSRGHLSIVAQINLLDITGTVTATVLQPGSSTLKTASGSVFAPLPVFGPEGRYYFAKNRVYVDGNIKGMYFFGYGDFFSTQEKVGIVLGRHIDFVAGYQIGSDLVVKGTSTSASIKLTQKGPTAGMEFTF